MTVSRRVKTRSSNKTVLPVDGDSTPVVLAQEPSLPHITHTDADSTPTPIDRELGSPNLTPTPAYSNPSWKYYTKDEGKCQLQAFVQELCVSNVIHGKYFALSHTFYLHAGYNTTNVPIFLYRERPIWKLRMR